MFKNEGFKGFPDPPIAVYVELFATTRKFKAAFVKGVLVDNDATKNSFFCFAAVWNAWSSKGVFLDIGVLIAHDVLTVHVI